MSSAYGFVLKVVFIMWAMGSERLTLSTSCHASGRPHHLHGLRPLLHLRGGDRSDFDRDAFEIVMKRRFFFGPSFSIYGGVSGLYDYGPPGCSMKACMLNMWREHFIVEDGMLEVDCATLTPEPVLKASGHLERFSDLMVRDIKTSECYRADRLLQEYIEALLEGKGCAEKLSKLTFSESELRGISERAGTLNSSELSTLFTALQIRAPKTKNELSEPYAFNLMFGTSIGPSGGVRGFLRPETAQGIFTNFRRLLDYNAGRLPFAAAQIGKAFRNEIAPKQGLLRVREFEMAEIEYFLRADDSTHPKFGTVAHLRLPLVPRSPSQTLPSDATLGAAMAAGVIANEALAYFMGRTYLFLLRCGIRDDRIRFRQHAATEMAHYASDCWDAEVLCSYGWVEVVGHADRACFDLRAHAEATGAALTAFQDYPHPIDEPAVEAIIDRRCLGQGLRQNAAAAAAALEAMALNNPADALKLKAQLDANGRAPLTLAAPQATAAAASDADLDSANGASAARGGGGGGGAAAVVVEVTSDMVKMRNTTRRVSGRSYLPRVVEPSFGMGRILYCALEHAFYVRPGGDEQRAVLRLPPAVAPVKCAVLAVIAGSPELGPVVTALEGRLRAAGVSCRADESSAPIGRRYARADELGIPFALTVDAETTAGGTGRGAAASAAATTPVEALLGAAEGGGYDGPGDGCHGAADGGVGTEGGGYGRGTVTLRERDTMRQVRVGLEQVVPLVARLARGAVTWDEVAATYPPFPPAAVEPSP